MCEWMLSFYVKQFNLLFWTLIAFQLTLLTLAVLTKAEDVKPKEKRGVADGNAIYSKALQSAIYQKSAPTQQEYTYAQQKPVPTPQEYLTQQQYYQPQQQEANYAQPAADVSKYATSPVQIQKVGLLTSIVYLNLSWTIEDICL